MFHLEVMALDAMDDARWSSASFAQGLQCVLRALPGRVGAHAYDCVGANVRLDSEPNEPRRTAVARHIAQLAGEFEKAARTDDLERARRVIPGLP